MSYADVASQACYRPYRYALLRNRRSRTQPLQAIRKTAEIVGTELQHQTFANRMRDRYRVVPVARGIVLRQCTTSKNPDSTVLAPRILDHLCWQVDHLDPRRPAADIAEAFEILDRLTIGVRHMTERHVGTVVLHEPELDAVARVEPVIAVHDLGITGATILRI